jgi:hypothetical protein
VVTNNTPTSASGVSQPKRGLTRNQIILLLRAVPREVVDVKQGKSYIPQWEARAAMNRIFGPGNWDSEVVDQELVYEKELNQGDVGYPEKGGGKPYFVACYKMAVRTTIRDYWGNQVASNVEYHVEENAPLPNRGEAHAFALTSCESYALRRALINLGDALGLHLYNKGRLEPVINKTLFLDDPESPLFRQKVAPEAAPAADEPATNALAAGFDHPEGRKD